MKFSPLAGAIAAIVLSCNLSAQAQNAAPNPDGDHHSGGAGAMREHMEHRREAHIKALHDILNIRPEQDAAFQAFVQSMHPMGEAGETPGAGDHEGWKHGGMAGMTAPERADAMVKHFDEHVAKMREHLARHAEAVKAFYAVLSTDQRRAFDALPGMMMGHGGMGGPGMHGHGPGMGGHRPMGGMDHGGGDED